MTKADLISGVAEFVDDTEFFFFASVSRGWRSSWGDRPTITKAVTASTSESQLSCCFECGLGQTAAVCFAAASVGSIDLLRLARSHGCPWKEDSDRPPRKYVPAFYPPAEGGPCAGAALAGHLGVIQWLRDNGCPAWQHPATCANAALGGHLNILKWLRANGGRWDAATSSSAAAGGHLDILKWARFHRCPWIRKTLDEARLNGHDHVVEWVQANGVPLFYGWEDEELWHMENPNGVLPRFW